MNKRIWYCNPFENSDCRKTGCYINDGPCHFTTKEQYALTAKGQPLKGPDIEVMKDGTVQESVWEPPKT